MSSSYAGPLNLAENLTRFRTKTMSCNFKNVSVGFSTGALPKTAGSIGLCVSGSFAVGPEEAGGGIGQLYAGCCVDRAE